MFTSLLAFSRLASESADQTSSSKTSTSSDSYFPQKSPALSSGDERITRIFNGLIKNDEFKTIWEEVNQNVHKPIKIMPSPSFGKPNFTKDACLAIKKTCPPDCPKKIEDATTIFPHAFGIYVNVEPKRTNQEIADAIIFETCNAKFWPQHQALDKDAETSMVDILTFATRREKIEYEALQMANTISETIKQKTSLFPKSASNPKIPDFDTHLKTQMTGGHFQDAQKQFLHIKQSKHRRTKSSA